MTPSSSLWEMDIHFALNFTYFSGKTIHLKEIDKILPLVREYFTRQFWEDKSFIVLRGVYKVL